MISLYLGGSWFKNIFPYLPNWNSEHIKLPSGGNQTIELRVNGPAGYAAGENFVWIDNFQIHFDNDDDGLGDAWETYNFGNLSRTGTGDPDADGLDNLQEFLNGTNPTLAELRVRISTPRQFSLLP
ncbi:MAG: hypothetical protein O2960_26410 [Verrucomicrobia bacterium]|nr:hypothetical protein [Verrucomicrobiota bacterium]